MTRVKWNSNKTLLLISLFFLPGPFLNIEPSNSSGSESLRGISTLPINAEAIEKFINIKTWKIKVHKIKNLCK